MDEKLEVRVSEWAGLPYVRVLRQVIWDLVEHLSCRRTQVAYSYDSTHFTVLFMNTDHAAVQKLLDDWAPADEHREPSITKFPRQMSWVMGDSGR